MDTYTSTDSYFSLLLALGHFQPMTVLAVFFLTMGRIFPIVAIAPFIGTKNVPATIRVMFSVSLIAIFLPQNLMTLQHDIVFNIFYIGYLLKEVLIGFVLAFLSTVPFLIAQMAGGLVDFQRGASSLQVSDPTTQTQTGPIGLLCNFVLIASFYALNGPILYFNGLADSYVVIPVDSLLSVSILNLQAPFWQQIYQLLAMMMRIATQLAAPALIGILLTDLFLGIANRLAPQVQIVFLGIALKSWVGIALMTAAWGLMIQVMSKESIQWMQTIQWLIQQVGLAYANK